MDLLAGYRPFDVLPRPQNTFYLNANFCQRTALFRGQQRLR